MIAPGTPAFNVASRGNVYYHLRMRTGERDLHSGLYGGAALNAAHALMQALSGVLARGGRLPEPLRRGIAPPSEEERRGWGELPPGDEALAEQGAQPADADAAAEFHLRIFAEPAVDVNGIETGSPHFQKTVIPVEAVANVSIRLAPGQHVEEISPEFERLLRASTPRGGELEIARWAASDPGLVAPDSHAVHLALDAFERVVGRRPALIRSGGTIPIIAALGAKGIPAIVTGFALPDCQMHSPNERLRADYVPLGIAAARETFRELAKLAG
jgi:acetylornithine deacetylase/succinyl-diaminopimelate desuccinylase-like protein